MAQTIYKILPAEEWQNACATDTYAGSDDDRRDGFVHFSTADQLLGTLNKYCRGLKGLHILAFDPTRFSTDELRWEPARGGALFPHLYSAFDIRLSHKTWQISVPDAGTIDLSFITEDPA